MVTTVENNRLYHSSSDRLGTKGTLKIVFSYLHATEVAANSIVCKRFFYVICEHDSVIAVKLLAAIRKATFQSTSFQRRLSVSCHFTPNFKTKNYIAWTDQHGVMRFSHRRTNMDCQNRHTFVNPSIIPALNSEQRLIAITHSQFAAFPITLIDTKTRKIHSTIDISQHIVLPNQEYVRSIFGTEKLDQKLHFVLNNGLLVTYNPATQSSRAINCLPYNSPPDSNVDRVVKVGNYLYLSILNNFYALDTFVNISYVNLNDLNQRGILVANDGSERQYFAISEQAVDDIFYVDNKNEVAGFRGSTKVHSLSYNVLKEKGLNAIQIGKIISTKHGVIVGYELGPEKKRVGRYALWNPNHYPNKNGIAYRFKLPIHYIFGRDTIQNQDDLVFVNDDWKKRVLVHHLPTRNTDFAVIPMRKPFWMFELINNVDMNTKDISFIMKGIQQSVNNQENALITFKQPRDLDINYLQETVQKNALSSINKKTCRRIIKESRVFKVVYFCYSLAKKVFCCCSKKGKE